MNIINMPAHSTNRWSRGGAKIQYIVLHYVGAVSTARNNGSYYGNTAKIGASAHFFVDEYDVVASVPLAEKAGHCGVDYSGGKAPFWGKCTNANSIGIEMCCKKDAKGNWYIEPETVNKAVALTRQLMAQYGLDADHVVRHYDVCWKQCPEPWVRDESQWNKFKSRLTAAESEDEDMVRYNKVSELPKTYRKDVQKLIDLGYLKGKGGPDKLDLTEDMARVLIINGRMQGVL